MTQSRKHAQHVDADLARQDKDYLQGAPHSGRAQEWREPEPTFDEEPESATIPRPDTPGSSPLHIPPDEIEARSRFGTYLARTAFPADRDDLIRVALSADAPDDILDDLDQLPDDQTFETPARAWAAMGHPIDQRF